jgi:hypothetical protein
MTTGDELRHILLGPHLDEKPAGLGIAGYRVTCAGDASEVLDRLREILAFILVTMSGIESVTSGESRASTKVAGDRLEGLQDLVDGELSQWLQHKVGQPIDRAKVQCVCSESRDWRWWDSRLRRNGEFLLLLEVSGWPCSCLDALRAITRYCGGETFDEIPKEQW